MASKVLVVGSGAIGLRTALELLDQQCKVVLKSAAHPLHPTTCSQGAGGLWMPYKCNDCRIDQWALETLDELLELSSLVNNAGAAVEIVPALVLLRENDTHVNNPPLWTKDSRIKFQTITPEILWWQNKVHKLRIPSEQTLLDAGYNHGWLFYPPIINTPVMLQEMLHKVKSHPFTQDVDVNYRNGIGFQSVDDIISLAVDLKCDAVVNCTGLGARALMLSCQDNSDEGEAMVEGRGILLHYRRSCERRVDFDPDVNVNDAVVIVDDLPWGNKKDESCYIIPRGDVMVVGGCYVEGNTDEMRPEEQSRLEENAWRLGIDIKRAKSIGKWTGFRPARPSIRVEIDKNIGVREGVKFLHNYGHGGSGWTVCTGVAKEVSKLLARS